MIAWTSAGILNLNAFGSPILSKMIFAYYSQMIVLTASFLALTQIAFQGKNNALLQ